MAQLVHIAAHVHSAGGMQEIIRQHRQIDAALGHASLVVALFEPAAVSAPIGLALNAWSTPAGIRRAFLKQAAPRIRDAVAVYHNAWGMPLLAPGDGAARRLAYLHTDWPELELAIRAAAAWADGFVVVSQALAERVRAAIPGFPPERIWCIDYPLMRPEAFVPESQPRPLGQPFRVGYVGRLEVRQKRVDRLAQAMRLAAPGWEWHILGDGSARRRLERAAPPGARFHGWLGGEAYWRTLSGLDAVVFFSDFEGMPIALLEALSVGAMAVYPSIGGDAEELTRHVDPACVYPAGDVAAAVGCLTRLAASPRLDRSRPAASVAGRTPGRYQAGFGTAIAAVAQGPRRSRTEAVRVTRPGDWLPMAAVRRWFPKAIWR